MERFRNYGLWVSLFSFIALFIKALKPYGVDIVLPDNYDELVTAFLGILVLAGIISNPKDGNWYSDSK